LNDCLRFALKAAQEIGMQTAYVDGYAGQRISAAATRRWACWCIWTSCRKARDGKTPPFAGTVKDGCVFGRGKR
jgi:hypothetical protein